MSYDCHITRKTHWVDEGDDITAEEWLLLVDADSTLHPSPENGPYFATWKTPFKFEKFWLDWSDGNVYSKNPDKVLLAEMYEIASELNAYVVGDDGEKYGSDGEEYELETMFKAAKRRAWFHNFLMYFNFFRQQPMVENLPFKVGDRVKSILPICPGTVVAIDLMAEHGLGRVSVRHDDGLVRYYSAIAHGLELDCSKSSKS